MRGSKGEAKGAVVSLRVHKFQSFPLRPLVGSRSPAALARLNLSCLSSALTVAFWGSQQDRDRDPEFPLLTQPLVLLDGNEIDSFH